MGPAGFTDMATSVGMNELHVTLGDRTYSFSPGETVRIGRSPDNDIVVGDPTVSRQHAQLSCGSDGWEWENVGRALSFLDGQPISRARLNLPASIQLASGHGPVLDMRPGAAAGGAPGHDHTSVLEDSNGWLAGSGASQGGSQDLGIIPGFGAGAAASPDEDPLRPAAADPGPAELGPADPADPGAGAPPGAGVPGPSGASGAPGAPGAPGARGIDPLDPAWGTPEGAPWGAPEESSWDSPGGGSAASPGGGSAASPGGTPWGSADAGAGGAAEPAPWSTPEAAPWGTPEADPYGPSAASDPYAPAAGADPYGPPEAQPGPPDSPAHEAPARAAPEAAAWGSAGSAEAAPPYGPGSAARPESPDATSAYGPADAPPYGTQQGGPDGSPQTAWEGAAGGQPYGGMPYPGGQQYPGGEQYPGWQPPPGGQHEVPRVRPVSAPPVDELATALHILVPIRSWLHDPGWRQFIRLLVIPYGLLPLVFIALFASSNNLSTPGWAYSLYIAPLWAIVFWLLIRPGPVGRREIGIAAGSIVFVLIWIHIVTININGLMGKAGRPLSFPGAIGVGINEEITKALPIFLAAILLLRMRQTKLDVRMWMFLGTLVGLAFGVTEQAGYTSLDIVGIAHSQGNSQAIVEVLAFAERVFVDGFQHAMWAGVSAFFIGMAVNYPRRRIQLIAFGIAVPAVLHGLYDWSAGAFASLWVPIMIQAVSLFLFLGYTMSAAAIERQVRQTPMFRGESMIMERIRDHHLSEQRPPSS
jgi:RsiW-degrading membrane proteinase PrsW (M82 family)